MRNSSKWYRVMTVVAGSGLVMGMGCGLSLAAPAFIAGFFGLLGVEAAAAPQIMLGLGQFLPFITGQ